MYDFLLPIGLSSAHVTKLLVLKTGDKSNWIRECTLYIALFAQDLWLTSGTYLSRFYLSSEKYFIARENVTVALRVGSIETVTAVARKRNGSIRMI